MLLRWPRLLLAAGAFFLLLSPTGCYFGMRVGKPIELGNKMPANDLYFQMMMGVRFDMGGEFQASAHVSPVAIGGEDAAGTEHRFGGGGAGVDASTGLWEARWKDDMYAVRLRGGGFAVAGGQVVGGVTQTPSGASTPSVSSDLNGMFSVGAGAEAGFENLFEDNWNDGFSLFVGAGLAATVADTAALGTMAFLSPYLQGSFAWHPWGIGRFLPGYNPPTDRQRITIVRDYYSCSALRPDDVAACEAERQEALQILIARDRQGGDQ